MKHFNSTHGLSRHPTYHRWISMMHRCYNVKSEKFSRYGGRGIYVENNWLSASQFIQDMGIPPFKGATIDRIDVNGPYSKENCRWATQKTQQNNRGNTRMITYKGETKPITEWGALLGVSSKVLRQRIDRDGMTIDQAFSRKAGEPTVQKFLFKEAIESAYRDRYDLKMKWNDIAKKHGCSVSRICSLVLKFKREIVIPKGAK